MKLLFLKKSKAAKKPEQAPDKLEYFRKLLLDHLNALDGDVMEKGGLPIGTIREWKGGRKYIKVGPGKWRPKYDGQTRGAKMAIAAIRRKVAAAQDAHEMMQIILEHRDRFSDKDGYPLPFVMELHDYINSTQAGREKAEQEKAATTEAEKKQAAEQAGGKEKNEVVEPEQDSHEEDGTERSQGESTRTAPDDKPETPATGLSENESSEQNNDDAKKNIIEKIRSHGIEITPQEGKYLFATGPADDGYFIMNGNLDYKAYDEIMIEAEKKGLKPPYHIYGNFETYQDKKNVDFHKLSETLQENKEAKEAKVYADSHPSENEGKAEKDKKDADEAKKRNGRDGNGGVSKEQQEDTKKKLEDLAVPMLDVPYTKEEYNKYFPEGTVKTPVKTVKMGTDQFVKLGRKDGGKRQSYIGAVYQTLTDPIVVIKEGGDDVYIKSFTGENGVSTFMSVEKDKDGGRFIVTNYKRHKAEILRKIKWADSIIFLKDDRGSPASMDKEGIPHAESSHTPTVSPESGKKSSEKPAEPEETEEEKRHNRSEAMRGNQNARKYGPKPQTGAEAKAEQEDVKKARARAGMPPVEKHERSSSMKDSTWDPKSKDYRYRDTGYIAGSRKELAQAYIKKMAKDGTQVTNDAIDWTGIEENDVAAAEIITKQNLMGKPDWEALQTAGLTGGAGYLINELYKTINSKPEKSTADTRYDFSRGLDAIRGRLEACKTLDDVTAVAGEINGEITGYYVSAIKTPEYLDLAKKQEAQNEKIKAHQEKLKEKIYEQGDPFLEADAFLKNNMGIYSGVSRLINPVDGSWKGSFYDMRGKNELLKLLRAGAAEYKHRQDDIEERTGIKLYDMLAQLGEIRDQMDEAKESKNKELSLVNDMGKAWDTFGNSFRTAIAVITKHADKNMYWGTSLDRNETFQKHYDKAGEIAADDFSWSEKKSSGGGPRKTQFELKVADHIVRRGGREVKAESTEDLKNLFNLRDVQSGNWVLNDPKSAKFHVDNIAMGLSDLADITGVPDNLVSLNGRLAIAIGARGHSKALAHYEPVERVINITKMKGGGSLGHEWFHAFDNLMADAMTGGRYNVFLTESGRYDDLTARQRKLLDRMLMYKRWMGNTKEDSSYYASDYEDAKAAAKKAGVPVDDVEASEDYIVTVKNAFANLAKTMMTGTTARTQDIYYTKDDYAYINSNEGKRMIKYMGVSKEQMDFDEALEKVSRWRRIDGKKPEQIKRLLAAYYDGNENGGGKSAKTKETTSHFYENAKRLESSPGKPYWSSIIEMGARAFSAYLNDRMADRGWENNYLAHATDNSSYDNHSPYPAGEEREAINTAFDELFRAINENNAIRKAIDLENMERIALENAGVIDAAIDRTLRFFRGLDKGCGSFDREKVILNRAGETIEDYRWVAKGPDVMLSLDKQAIEPHAELVKEAHDGGKTIAVDFDGVINSYKSGWKGPTETDEPVLSAAESISSLFNRGYRLIIFSTRAQTPEGVETIREYLRKHTENDLLVNSIEITDRKPIADVYIDDRAIPFTGNWEETLEKIEAFEPWVGKSLTYSGYPLQGRTKVQGMDISIENKKGSTRSGTDKDGHEWSTKMNFDYGYIRGTVGVDKDHLDAYVGPNPESEMVYIVNQNDPVTGNFDEQKVMLGFNSEEAAKAAYLKQYDRPGFFGNIVKMDIDTFKEKAFDVRNKGKPLQKTVA